MMRNVLALSCALLMSCGPRPPAEEPEPTNDVEPEPEPEPEDELEVVGLTGSLSQSEVNGTMEMKAIPAFNLCFEFYLEDHEFLFGDLKLGFKVLPSGKVSEVTLLHSTYGDYKLEKCFTGKSKFIKFPEPRGGGTEVTYDFSTDVLPGVTSPQEGSTIKLKKALSPFQPEIKECLGGKDAGYSVTFYLGDSMSEEVENDKGKLVTKTLSRVLTLGGYGPDGDTDGIECLYDAARSWKLEMDVDGVRKVTLEL
jgi:hypothetical protein